jgi:hypothetical protein
MSDPITLTEAQCYEAIERWQDYAVFMYHTERGVALFATNSIQHDGRHVTMSIEPDGRIAATRKEDGVKVVYDVVITTAPLQGDNSLDNVQYLARVSDVASLPPNDQTYFNGLRPFVYSLFQRTVANQFIARMAPETIKVIAHDLSLAAPKAAP